MLGRLLSLVVTLGLVAGVPVVAMAQNAPPTPPHIFTGRATVDGAPAGEGIVVTAWVDGLELARAPLTQGSYVLLAPQPVTGQTLSFAIGDLPAEETATWTPGGASLLNLTTQMSKPPLPTVLDTLEDNLVRVFHRNPNSGVWTYYDPVINPWDRNRFRLAPGQEYWVKMDRDQLVVHHQRETRLVAGWNVVTW